MTPIYHPNIDSEEDLCDTLKMQPQGCWSPSININTVLLTIRLSWDSQILKMDLFRISRRNTKETSIYGGRSA